VKELDTKELSEQEEQRLVVDVRDIMTAQSALRKAGIVARSNGRNSLVITDKELIQNPGKIAVLLVEAGCPPARLIVEQGDLESYFLELVGTHSREETK
jgi:ABC-2 type transport system ATP-binding protein